MGKTRESSLIFILIGLLVVCGLLVWFFAKKGDDSPADSSVTEVSSEIVSVKDSSVELKDGEFSITDDLKTWLNPSNLPVLEGAVLKAKVKDVTIEKIISLEITADGQSLKERLVLDGDGGNFEGKLVVKGDYLTVKEMTIQGDLEIGSGVNNSFYLDSTTVRGDTVISEVSDPEDPTAVFTDSDLQSVTIARDGAILEFKGSTRATEIIFAANATLKTALEEAVPSVNILGGVSEVQIYCHVDDMLIDTTAEELTVNGEGNISAVTIESDGIVRFNMVGNIERMEITSPEARIILGKNTTIDELILPEGLAVGEVVLNYDDVKGNIKNPAGTEQEPAGAVHASQPSIIKNPSSQTVAYGSNFSISVDAKVNEGTLSYQWQISKDGGKTWTNIPGATGKSYTNIGVENGSSYRCIVTNTNKDATGNKTASVTSVAAHIIVKNAVSEMEVISQPAKLRYFAGEKLDLSGLSVKLTYWNGETEVVGFSKFAGKGLSVKPENGSILSKNDIGPVVISERSGQKAYSNSLIVDEIVLESIVIKTLPHKTIYKVGERLDLTGLVVEGIYNNGKSQRILISADDVFGFDSSKPSDKQVIHVGPVFGKIATFEIKIGKADGPGLEGVVTANDQDNTLTGLTDAMEFSTDGGKTWTRYSGESGNLPDLTGNIILLVRVAETDTHAAGPIQSFTFTEAILVKEIIVTSTGDKDRVLFGNTLKMKAEVKPAHATNKEIIWSVENGTGAATINADGLLTATKVGTVTVKATARDGSKVVGTKEILILPITVDIAAIEGVLVPVTGEIPVSKIKETDQFTGTVTWSPADSPFAPEKIYTATITLTAKEGYTLSGVSENLFTVEGATTVTNEADSGVITVVFPATSIMNEFAGGKGTADDPWQIAKPYQLDNLRNYLGEEHKDKHFILVDNIDLSGYASVQDEEGQGWVPIGDKWIDKFMGTLNGNGFTISNLYINRPEKDYVGLFGYCFNAFIYDVHLVNVDVTGYWYVGGLAGTVTSSDIASVKMFGTVKGTGSFVGGLAGWIEGSGSTVTDVQSDCDVSGDDNTGGLLGYSEALVMNAYATGKVSGYDYDSDYIGGLAGKNLGEIRESYATGDVSGMDDVGGLAGYNNGRIKKSHASGNVIGEIYVGGLAGYNNEDGEIMLSYATGSVTGTEYEWDTNAGGLVGCNYGAIFQSFATGDVTGISSVGGLIGFNNGHFVSDTFATGSVKGNNKIGGLIGLSQMAINNSYATGAVYGNELTGGLIGYAAFSYVKAYSSYWDIQTTGQTASSRDTGTGKTTEEMKLKETFSDWDFDYVWDIHPEMNDGYPYLRLEEMPM